jgi:sulfate adenylyltransferase subunit 1
VVLKLQAPIACLPYHASRALGSLVLVDTVTHRTAGPLLLS